MELLSAISVTMEASPLVYGQQQSPDSYAYPHSLVINTTTASYRGYLDVNTTDVNLYKWYEIHFAATTGGAIRWLPPQPYTPPSYVQNASAMGALCTQGDYNAGYGTQVQSEECLSLNVVAPVGAQAEIRASPRWLRRQRGIQPEDRGFMAWFTGFVYVSYNCRLALFGFPASSPEIAEAVQRQNLAVLGTRAAVEWTFANIAHSGAIP